MATLRQARGTDYPDPVEAALIAEKVRARTASRCTSGRIDGISRIMTSSRLKSAVMQTHMNLEMAVTGEMLDIARRARALATAAWCRKSAKS